MGAVAENRSPVVAGIDLDRLEEALKGLAHVNRLELLALLRSPSTLDEIRLTPGASRAGDRPGRPISRQAVQRHLDQLIALGLVRVRAPAAKDKRAHKEYVVDQAQLFALAEEFRQVGRLQSVEPVDPKATVPHAPGARSEWDEGAKLVLAHGVDEGRPFYLRRSDVDEATGRGWVIGRSKDAHVSLDYDPFVSSQNSEILPTDDGYELIDLRTARNGTFHNWRRLPVGGSVRLQSGDVVGVGRSLLIFRHA